MIVDDEPLIRKSLYEILKIAGYDTHMAASGEEGAERLKKEPFDILITDLKLPQMSGIELLALAKQYTPNIEVIVITGQGSIETAVEAMKKKAFDYITKPIVDEDIKRIIGKIIEKNTIRRENAALKERVSKIERSSFSGMIGKSPAIQDVFTLIETVANSNATIMITGESGTGKGVVARAIHANDEERKAKPFVEVNCGALSETLLESELFGHVKGAFTGAIKDKAGRFEAAKGGTIFLDEIDTCSPGLQVKLLRVLQDGGYEAVGDTTPRRTDARIIVATNRELEHMIHEGDFREDLYYRIHVIPIIMPPLRERREDIDLLTQYFIGIYNAKNKKQITGISPDVRQLFMEHAWPGNIRQLEHVIEGAVVMAKTAVIQKEDLPKNFTKILTKAAKPDTIQTKSLEDSLAEPAKDIILAALNECHGNRTKAAAKLGIDRTTLYNKMKKYGIQPND